MATFNPKQKSLIKSVLENEVRPVLAAATFNIKHDTTLPKAIADNTAAMTKLVNLLETLTKMDDE